MALSLSMSKRVPKLIGAATHSAHDKATLAGATVQQAEEQDPGAEVEVVLHYVEMETDTSQITPIANCLSDMMTPRAADQKMAEETEKMRCMVQLQPEVAKAMTQWQEEQAQMVMVLDRLQNRYAEIEKEQLALEKRMLGEANKTLERFEAEKSVLRAQLSDKRTRLAQIHKKLNALKIASAESEKNSRIARITLRVVQGVWYMGPVNQRLARVSLKGMTHMQANDIELGVPVEHKFHLTHFQIESLLSDQWNKQFRQVLGPLSLVEGQDLDAAAFEQADNAMISVTLHQLPKPDGNQVAFSSMLVELHPLRIQITEDLYNCLYGFAFPGKWVVENGRSEWLHDAFHNITVLDTQTEKMVTFEQKREFYRLPVTSCLPCVVKGISLGRSRSSHSTAIFVEGNLQRVSSYSDAADKDMPSSPSTTSDSGTGGQKETQDLQMVQELKLRARDHIEFQEVAVYASQRIAHLDSHHAGLAVSISYKGRKGAFPDIDGLVIQVPDVHFPKHNEGALVCSWKELYDTWLTDVRWPIMQQATGNIWKKVKWWRTKEDASTSLSQQAQPPGQDDSKRQSSILSRSHAVRSTKRLTNKATNRLDRECDDDSQHRPFGRCSLCADALIPGLLLVHFSFCALIFGYADRPSPLSRAACATFVPTQSNLSGCERQAWCGQGVCTDDVHIETASQVGKLVGPGIVRRHSEQSSISISSALHRSFAYHFFCTLFLPLSCSLGFLAWSCDRHG